MQTGEIYRKMNNQNLYVESDKTAEFPENRYRHCFGVGQKMYWYAKLILKWPEEKCKKMFVLGNLHDIGYYFSADSFGHNEELFNILQNDYKYAEAIRSHSYLQEGDISEELKLLYYGDATVDGSGNWVTYEQRLNDLANRHGIDSEVYKESKRVIQALQRWGFIDIIEDL